MIKDIKHFLREKLNILTYHLYVKNEHLGDSIGFLLLGVFSLGYIVFLKELAERHIQFPFLNFPIFVGEMLLFICLLLFLAKYRNSPQKLTKWHYLILCYFIFVIIKALHGYLNWGPLALRHAALLYYPVFAVFGYAFYRKDFFSKEKCLLLLLLISLVFLLGKHKDSGTLTLVLLGFILIKSYPNKTIRFLMFLTFLCMIPYKAFFLTARMMIVSNFLSGLYLAGALPFTLKVKKILKFPLILLIAGVVIVGLYKFAPHTAVKSIVNVKRMAEMLNIRDAEIRVKIKDFKMKTRKEVKLYNPDKKVITPDKKVDVLKKTNAPRAEFVSEEKVKAQIRQTLIERVKERINEFVLWEGKDKFSEGSVEEVKKEVELVLAKVESPEVPKPSQAIVVTDEASVTEAPQEAAIEEVKEEPELVLAKVESPEVPKPSQAIVITDEASVTEAPQEAAIEEVKKEPELVLAKVESPEVPKPSQTIVVTDEAAATETPKEAVVEEVKKEEIRQMFFEKVKQEIQTASVDHFNEVSSLALVEQVKEEMQSDLEKGFQRKGPDSSEGHQPVYFNRLMENTSEWVINDNAVFRLLIWRDLLVELAKEMPKSILGFSFGKPFRSISLEVLKWGYNDWHRDGWIAAHNSYLEIIYRAGIIGILLILSLWIILFKMIKQFIQWQSLTGILLCGIIINWFVAANFLLIFELPFTAIPIWTIYGMTLAYHSQLRKGQLESKT